MTDTRYAGFDWDVAKSRERRTKRWSVYGSDVLDLTVAEMDLPIAAPDPDGSSGRRRAANRRLSDPGPAVRGARDCCEVADRDPWAAGGRGSRQAAAGTDEGHHQRRPRVHPTGFAGGGAHPDLPQLLRRDQTHRTRRDRVPMRHDDSGYRLDYERIDKAFADGAGSLVLCHPANPVGRLFAGGATTTRGHRRRHGARVISDEIHAPLRYQPDFVPYAAVHEVARQHAVTLFSATKAWNIPGLRCGFVALTNSADARRWDALPGAATGGISPLGMIASAVAFEHGEPWLNQAVEFLAGNRALLARRFADAGISGIYAPPEATYLAWLDLRRLGVNNPAALLLEKAAIATIPALITGRPRRLRTAQLRHPTEHPRRGGVTAHRTGPERGVGRPTPVTRRRGGRRRRVAGPGRSPLCLGTWPMTRTT